MPLARALQLVIPDEFLLDEWIYPVGGDDRKKKKKLRDVQIRCDEEWLRFTFDRIVVLKIDNLQFKKERWQVINQKKKRTVTHFDCRA